MVDFFFLFENLQTARGAFLFYGLYFMLTS